MLRYNGCIVADSVGLGKTYEALAVIKYFELKNERVLVLCPLKLRENWTVYKANSRLNPFLADRFRYDVLLPTSAGSTAMPVTLTSKRSTGATMTWSSSTSRTTSATTLRGSVTTPATSSGKAVTSG
jgi:hypothetical protein